jgi:hypothetical protein
MSSISTSNVTSGFIDLATFDEIEKYLYGGPDATAYFVRETRKATWFTQVPVVLSKASGSAGFNQEWSVSISRAGDYMLHTWLRVTIPEIVSSGPTVRLRWTRNLMHNLVRECSITFNDLIAARFDNFHLDFWAAFTVPEGKRNGYKNMIGDIDQLTQPAASLPSATLNLPLPFFYSRDSGVALPTAALPYNEMRINFYFRDWNQLLINQTGTGASDAEGRQVVAPDNFKNSVPPVLGTCQVWANYAIVSNDERKRMACAPRDILIEQVQTAPKMAFNPATSSQQSFDIRFSHAIKVLFFAVVNVTFRPEGSNYVTTSPVMDATTFKVDFTPDTGANDPISQTSLIYENTNRLAQMGSDYFSLVNPWYHAPVIPVDTGYHSYSYSLDFISLDPMGSTNYGKLTNVSIVPEASARAILCAKGAGGPGGGSTIDTGSNSFKQVYDFIVTAVNNNIIRVSGGALGFPVL